MSLNYILGKAGSGKTSFIIDKILKIYNNKTNIIYLVPEQFTLISERKILDKLPKNTMMTIKVVNFQRLAYHFFNEMGFNKLKTLDEIGKIILIRKILIEIKDKFLFYKKIKITEGFIKKLSKTITELYNFSININDIKNIIDNNTLDSSLSLKIKDIYLIYNLYCEYISKEYISTDESLDILYKNIDKSDYIDNSTIFIDGFTGFTEQEYKVINKLLKKSKDLYISLTNKEKEIYYKDMSIIDLFYETKYTINKITKIAKEENINIKDPIYLNSSKRHKDIKEFCYLENNFFNFKNKIYKEKNNHIKIYNSNNLYDEVKFVAKYIVKLIRDNNYKYCEIGIVVSDINLYEHIIEDEFYKHKIPIFIDKKENILFHPVLELICSYLNIIISNFSYESIFKFLKTGLTDLKYEDIDIIENYVLEFAITGNKWKEDNWTYGFDKYDKDKIYSIKNQILKILSHIYTKIQKNKLYKIEDICICIFDMLLDIDIESKMNNMIIESENLKYNEITKYHNQILNKISYIFEKIVDILGDKKVNIKEFYQILESCFLCEKMAIIPPTQDQIILADSERSKLDNIKALFILGVNEGIFPTIKEESTLFTDEDKDKFKNLDVDLGKTINEHYFYDNFIIYNLLLKPEELLILTYNKVNLDSKVLFPSFIINRLKSMFENIFVKLKDDIVVSDKDFMLEQLVKDLNRYICTENISKESLNIYKLLANDISYKHILKNINKIIFNLDNKKKLRKSSIKKLYGKEIPMTISKFQNYAECPFSFFIRHNLNIKERKIHKVSNKDIGNIFHKLLDDIVKNIFSDGIEINKLNKLKISNYVNNSLKNITNYDKNNIFISDINYNYLIYKLKKVSKKSLWAIVEHLKKGDFLLYDTEVSFGVENTLNYVSIDIDSNNKFIFSGIIDRIDTMDLEDKKYIKIIDYKSGNKKFDVADINYGMQLQLLLYLKSILENGKDYFNIKNDIKIIPAGIFYFNIGDFITEIDRDLESNEEKDIILDNYKMSGIVLENDKIINSIDKSIHKNSNVINIFVNNDGSYSKKSSIVKEEDFYKIIDYAIKKIKEIGNNLISGKIEASPYKKLDLYACKYCKYNSICRFDSKNKYKFKYNNFKDRDKLIDIKNFKE